MNKYYKKLEENKAKAHSDIIKFIARHVIVKRISPTNKEISDHLGVTITAIVNRINQMSKEGLVTKIRNQSRSIAITNKGMDLIGD